MIVVEYDEKWPECFNSIKNELLKVIKVPCEVQHVGSTSVYGMIAKPVIDIDVALDNWKDFCCVKNELSKIGYAHEGDLGIKGREAFSRNGTFFNEILDSIEHHLYVCSASNDEYKRHVLFRNYLRKHDEARDEYNRIKLEILNKVGAENRAAYVQMKQDEYSNFFEEIIKMAAKENCSK
jgi:GrpB-like predicted nucleotidyltransferase (UPF0157 family)